MAKLIDGFYFMMYLIHRQSAIGPIYTMFIRFKIYISSSLEKKKPWLTLIKANHLQCKCKINHWQCNFKWWFGSRKGRNAKNNTVLKTFLGRMAKHPDLQKRDKHDKGSSQGAHQGHAKTLLNCQASKESKYQSHLWHLYWRSSTIKEA